MAVAEELVKDVYYYGLRLVANRVKTSFPYLEGEMTVMVLTRIDIHSTDMRKSSRFRTEFRAASSKMTIRWDGVDG